MKDLTQIVDQENQRLIDNNSIYRYKLVGDNLIDLIDIEGQPAYDDPESRYIEPSAIVGFTTDLIAAEQSYR